MLPFRKHCRLQAGLVQQIWFYGVDREITGRGQEPPMKTSRVPVRLAFLRLSIGRRANSRNASNGKTAAGIRDHARE